MLVAAAGNTAMQSLMPSIGRVLDVPDLWIAGAFSLSAAIWVIIAPHWAHMADKRGRRALMRLGLYGFIASMLVCGLVLAAGLAGWLAPATVFAVFVIGRCFYGAYGSASPPAVQAYVAARTDGEQRTIALAAIASSFGLGTIIGPALAPLFILPPFGLSGPLLAFALIGLAVLAALVLRLPDDTPHNPAQGQIIGEPLIGAANSGAALMQPERASRALGWRDPRILNWHVAGIVGGHGHAALLGTIGFLVIDRLGVAPDHAQQWIALVLMAGAGATLLAQWGLIPRLGLDPRALLLWGSWLAAAGAAITGLSEGIYGITTGFALASLGFGFFRPGFTSGASLAVGAEEQNAVAGMVTSVNGVAFVAAPTIGVALYGLWMPLPFLLAAGLMVLLAVWISLRLSPSAPAA